MEVKLADGWILSDETSASPYGALVLIDTVLVQAYGPDDIINLNGEDVTAVRVMDRLLADMKELSSEEVSFVRRFFLG